MSATGSAHRDAFDVGAAADDAEAGLVGTGQHRQQARLARAGRAHDGEGGCVREDERHSVDDARIGAAARGARDRQIGGADRDIGVSTAGHVLILPCGARVRQRGRAGERYWSVVNRWRSASSSRSRIRIARPSSESGATRWIAPSSSVFC